MRLAALVATAVGIALSLYVTIAASQRTAEASYPFPVALVLLTMIFAGVGVVAAPLTWRSHRGGPWLLVIGALAGFVVWPWFETGVAYLVAAVLSLWSVRAAGLTVGPNPQTRRFTRSMKRAPWRRLAVISLVASCPSTTAACVATPPVEAPCAVTLPAARPVPSITEVPVSASRFSWFGTTTLAVNIPNDGTYRVQIGSSSGRAKVAWWRSDDETIDITAERVESNTPTVHTRAPLAAAGDGQFVPGEIVFPAYGCWRVSGTTPTQQLTFVMRVREATPGEVAP